MTVWIDYYSTKMVPPPPWGGCSPKFSREAHVRNRVTYTAHEAALLFYTVSPCCQRTSELLSKSSTMVVWEVVLIVGWGTVLPLRKLMWGLCALPPFLCKRSLWEGEKGGIHWLNYIEKGNGKDFLITVARAVSKDRLDLIITPFYFVSLTNFLS